MVHFSYLQLKRRPVTKLEELFSFVGVIRWGYIADTWECSLSSSQEMKPGTILKQGWYMGAPRHLKKPYQYVQVPKVPLQLQKM